MPGLLLANKEHWPSAAGAYRSRRARGSWPRVVGQVAGGQVHDDGEPEEARNDEQDRAERRIPRVRATSAPCRVQSAGQHAAAERAQGNNEAGGDASGRRVCRGGHHAPGSGAEQPEPYEREHDRQGGAHAGVPRLLAASRYTIAAEASSAPLWASPTRKVSTEAIRATSVNAGPRPDAWYHT